MFHITYHCFVFTYEYMTYKEDNDLLRCTNYIYLIVLNKILKMHTVVFSVKAATFQGYSFLRQIFLYWFYVEIEFSLLYP